MSDYTANLKPYKYKYSKNQLYEINRYKWIIFLLGAIYLFHGIERFNEEIDLSAYLYSILGVALVIVSFYKKKQGSEYLISIDSSGIKFLQFMNPFISSEVNLNWKDIKSVTITPLKIIFLLKNNKRRSIKLDLLSYKDIKILKERLKDFLILYNIELT